MRVSFQTAARELSSADIDDADDAGDADNNDALGCD